MARVSLLTAAVLVLLSLAGLAAGSQPAEQAFRDFIEKFGRQYVSKAEEERRFAIFQANYAHIQAENAKGLAYKLAVNEFADQEPEEFQAGRLGLRQPAPGTLWAGAPHLGTHHYSGGELPKAVDWTKKGAVTTPKNQKQCGSCWSFSTTGALEGAWQIAGGGLVSLSEQQLVDCSKGVNQGCKGGSMDAAFEFIEKHAMCTEDSYPYEAKDGKCRAASCTSAIPSGSVTGYKDVEANDEKALMEAVSKQPVAVAIEADQMAFQLYSHGILTKECGAKLDHGVLLVGYGSEDGVKYWKVKNSWGASWGEEGYIRLERSSAKKAGECGINSQPSYPVVKRAPGPAPGPAPPTPPAPATPAHYESPPCQSDEIEARIQGARGVTCAPQCDRQGGCPTDTPPSTSSTPKCCLRSPTGKQYCALPCEAAADCPPSARCADLGAVGVCIYPEDTRNATLSLYLSVAAGAGAEIVV